MAKKNISTKFTKARLYKNDDTYIVAEVGKDEIEVEYNFSKILDSYEDIDGLNISISSTKDIAPMDEVADD